MPERDGYRPRGTGPKTPPTNPPNQGSSGMRPPPHLLPPLFSAPSSWATEQPPTDHVPGGRCPFCGARHEREARPVDVPVVLAWLALVAAATVLVGAFGWLSWDLGWAALDVLRRGLGIAP